MTTKPKSPTEAAVEALEKAADMIESEYCSHNGTHAADNESCYADFIYKALALLRTPARPLRELIGIESAAARMFEQLNFYRKQGSFENYAQSYIEAELKAFAIHKPAETI